MKSRIIFSLLILLIGTEPFAEAKRPGKKKIESSQAAGIVMPDLQSVLGTAYDVPLELSDRAMPGSILEITPFGYQTVMSRCVGTEPKENAFTNITMQSSLSGGVSYGVGGQGASVSASQSVGLKFISPYILGFEGVDFEPSADCTSKLTSYVEKKGYKNLVVVQEALFAKINGCSEVSGGANVKVQSFGGNASMNASCQMFSNDPVAVGVRLVDLTNFMGIKAATTHTKETSNIDEGISVSRELIESPDSSTVEIAPTASNESRTVSAHYGYEPAPDFLGVLLNSSNSIKKCFLDERNRSGILPNNIEVYLNVLPSGSIVTASIFTREYRKGKFEKCLTSAIKKIELPPTASDGVTKYHFTFVV